MLGKVILRNSVLSSLDMAVGLVVSFATAGIVARKLGPEKMGHYAFAIWVTAQLISFSRHSVAATVNKYVAEYLGRGDIAMAKTLTRLAFWVECVGSVFFVSIGLIYIHLRVAPGFQLFNSLVLISMLPVMIQAVPTVVNVASENFAANVWPGMITTLLQPISIYFALGLKMELVGLALGQLLCRSVDMTLRLWFFRNRFDPSVAPVTIPDELRGRLWRFCFQSTGLLLLDLIVWDRCEVFFLERFSTLAQVSFYSIAFQLSGVLMSLPNSFAGACGATLMVQRGRDPESMNSMVVTWLRFAALLVFPLTLGMAALSGAAIRLIYGAQFLPAIPVIALMSVLNIPKALMVPAQQLLVVLEKQGFIVRWMIFSAGCTVLLDYLLIPRYAAMGATWGNGIAQMIAAAGIWIYATRKERLRLPWSELARMAACAVAMAAACFLLTFLLRPLLAALLGVLAGAVLYAVLLRIFRSFKIEDEPRLMRLETQMPFAFRSFYTRGVRWLFL
jgi:O-antigen/teichoic acid export membrane protein